MRIDYLKALELKAYEILEGSFKFSKSDFTSYHVINAFLIERIISSEKTNLLISLPTKDMRKNLLLITILLPVLKCYLYNTTLSKSISVGDVIIKTDCGTISAVKAINDNQIVVLPIGTRMRVTLLNDESFIILSQWVKEKIIEIENRDTILKRQKGIENLKSRLLSDVQEYQTLTNYLRSKSQFPSKHKTKVVVVASKKEFLSLIPSCIPYQYINKSGEIYLDTPFDPILYVVNDFATVKEFIIEKDVEIDTIIFVGDNKYRATTTVSRLSRQGKFNRCIFIGTEDIESTDKFKIMKWNWTLSETKYFSKATNSKINIIKLSHPALSNSILDFIKIVEAAEQQNDNLINLKKSLRYIRKIYPTTALNIERIKSRANEIYQDFEQEIEELFQDEYQSIDKDYKPDFENLKERFKKTISIIKNDNAKAQWFKEQASDIDYIIVPKVIKVSWEKEIEKCLQNQQVTSRVRSLADLSNLSQPNKQNLQFYKGLKSTQVITLKEFEQKETAGKKYLFLSFYGYGVYPETLLEKIYQKNVVSEIMLYEEEYKAFQYHLHKFNERAQQEFRSVDREKLSGIKYPITQTVNTENIDEWIKYLIEADNFKFSKAEDIRYEITFEEVSKKLKERESKNVYVEGYEEHHKEIHELKKGDKVRIYQNPDIETLHDIIKMTDEKELFSKVDKIASLWKISLTKYAYSTAINNKLLSLTLNRNLVESDINSTPDEKKAAFDAQQMVSEIIVNELTSKALNFVVNNVFDELAANGLTVSKNQLENWMQPDNKTKFPKRIIDLLVIIKTVNNEELKNNREYILQTRADYLGTLNHKGRKFAEEIDAFILTGEKGEMLNWLSNKHIEQIIAEGAPLLTIKEIGKLDYEITD